MAVNVARLGVNQNFGIAAVYLLIDTLKGQG